MKTKTKDKKKTKRKKRKPKEKTKPIQRRYEFRRKGIYHYSHHNNILSHPQVFIRNELSCG